LEREDLERIFQRYGVDIPVRDVNWYRKALTHRSYCTRKNENFLQGNTTRPEGCLPLQEDSNECLEFLGDAVLGAVVGAYLKERYPDENEGFLTRMRTKLVNGEMLSRMCKMAGLERYIIISRQIEENNGRSSKNVLEDCFEAFIGAVFEDAPRDQQFNMAREWLEAFIEEHIDFTELVTQHGSHKDTLCKYFQHAFNCMPRFVDIDDSITGAHFTVCVKNKENAVVGKGTGATKKMAENAASKKALVYFGVIRA
jgi:ribonuclease-3